MKHTNDVNDVEEGQNVNTLSEIEEYYKAREQQLLKKLHRQEAALAAAEQTLKRLTENQKAPMDETTEQRTAQEQAFKEKLYRDPLTGIYNRRYYEEVVRKSIGPAGIALMDGDDFKICNDTYGHYADIDALLKSLDCLETLEDVDYIVPGHGPVVTKDYIPKQRAFIYEWIAAVAKGIEKGWDLDECIANISFADRFPMDIGQEETMGYVQRTNVIKCYHYLTHKK